MVVSGRVESDGALSLTGESLEEVDACRVEKSRACLFNVISSSWHRLLWPLKTIASSLRLRHRKAAADSCSSLDLEKSSTTVRYLAYGSNLSAETFLGRRGIRPISQTNVCVPTLKMTFDLPGIPYNEPCFANTALRDPDSRISEKAPPYRKDDWHKPLVGVLYELTPEDFAHVLATEGGGASYQDVIVTCYPLVASSSTVPMFPDTEPIKGHTLFAPAESPPPSKETASKPGDDGGRFHRPDPAYAQASARYLKLITDGAAEHDLPLEYREYLANLRPYRATTTNQQAGRVVFVAVWLPVLTTMFALTKLVADNDGKSPKWMVQLLGSVFQAIWLSYDGLFKNLFGDGERTIGE